MGFILLLQMKNIPFSPSKKLGQNFLFDKNYLKKIVKECPINENALIIEIGTGYGSLTEFLINIPCKKIISLEKDKNIFNWVKNNWKENKKITFLNQDALEVNWEKFLEKYTQEDEIIIIGNIAYNIANTLICELLLNYKRLSKVIFLIQKELAEKWIATSSEKNKNYSALSVYINSIVESKIAFNISRKIFTPSPLVDGSLIVIKKKKNIIFEKKYLLEYLRFLKKCFLHRRKTLWNNLLYNNLLEKEVIEKLFKKFNYKDKIRPQELSVEDYLKLFDFLLKN